MEYIDKLIIPMIAVFGTSFATAIILFGKWLLSIKKNTEQMIENGQARAGENQVQQQMLRSHGRAIRATLEVVAKNQNNGNVERAFKSLDEADKVYSDYTDGLIRFKNLQRAQ